MLPLATLQLWFNISSINRERIGSLAFGPEAVYRSNSEFDSEKVLITLFLCPDSNFWKLFLILSDTLQPCLVSTGILWEFCDRLPTLPKNNKEAVLAVLSREEELINDAIEELEQVSFYFFVLLFLSHFKKSILGCGCFSKWWNRFRRWNRDSWDWTRTTAFSQRSCKNCSRADTKNEKSGQQFQ